jgi:chromosome segregation ATPase
MTPDEIKRKIEELQKRTDVVSNKKAAFGGQLKAKKDELAALIVEIKAAGLDPKSLISERDKAKAELETMIASYEAELSKSEVALSAYDNKK